MHRIGSWLWGLWLIFWVPRRAALRLEYLRNRDLREYDLARESAARELNDARRSWADSEDREHWLKMQIETLRAQLDDERQKLKNAESEIQTLRLDVDRLTGIIHKDMHYRARETLLSAITQHGIPDNDNLLRNILGETSGGNGERIGPLP